MGGFVDQRAAASSGGGELGEDELYRVPGRMFLNGASDVACLFTRQSRKGTNLDAMVVWEVWDVLSNKELVDIVASAPTRVTAARALVGCAVRAGWLKFPTSKIDDCAVVCLFLTHPPSDQARENNSGKALADPAKTTMLGLADQEATSKEEKYQLVSCGAQTYAYGLDHSYTIRDADEIVPLSEEPKIKKDANEVSI